MLSSLPKVLQTLGGHPMLVHLLKTAATLDPEQVHVVIGSGADQVKEACDGFDVNWVNQAQVGIRHQVKAVSGHLGNVITGAQGEIEQKANDDDYEKFGVSHHALRESVNKHQPSVVSYIMWPLRAPQKIQVKAQPAVNGRPLNKGCN